MRLTGTTTQRQSEPEDMATKENPALPKPPELEPYHQMQFSVIPRTPLFFGGEVLRLCRGYSWHILSSHQQNGLSQALTAFIPRE